MTFFTADQHFGHQNIIELCQRPFADVKEMNRALIENWNKVVKPSDDVWVLGDIFFKATDNTYFEIMPELNGNLYLIKGNHDHRRDYDIFFVGAFDYKELTIDTQHITLFHYPMVVWNGHLRGAWQLYGHVHGNPVPEHNNRKAYDVGVDCNYFTPVSFEDLQFKLKNKQV